MTVKAKSKKPRQWASVTLGSEVSFLSGGTPNMDTPRYWGGEIPWVSSGEMKQRRISSTSLSVTEAGAREGSKMVPDRTILAVVRGMSLAKEFRVAITKRPVAFNQDLKALVPSVNLHPEFLFYYLLSQNGPIRDSASESGHGTKKLDTAVLENWPLPIPPLDTQRKIAAILTAYDDLIETNKRRIALLETMAEELYREWFVRMRSPGHQNTKFVKGVPVGWDRTPIGELTLVLSRGISPKYSDTSERVVINQKCIRDGEIDWSHTKTHESSIPENKVLKHGDILVNSTGVGTLGRSVILWDAGSDLACDSHVTICRADPEKVAYLYLGFAVRLLRSYFDYLAVGATGQTELNQSFISKTKILIPTRELQMKFQEVSVPQLQLANDLRKANENLTQTRDMLLPRLISGKLSVEDLDIQFPPSMREEA